MNTKINVRKRANTSRANTAHKQQQLMHTTNGKEMDTLHSAAHGVSSAFELIVNARVNADVRMTETVGRSSD